MAIRPAGGMVVGVKLHPPGQQCMMKVAERAGEGGCLVSHCGQKNLPGAEIRMKPPPIVV